MANEQKPDTTPESKSFKAPETSTEAELGKQMEKFMQELMRNNPQVMAKVMNAIQEDAKASEGKGTPIRLIFKILREDLPPKEWAKIEASLKQRDANAPQEGDQASDFCLPIMGTEETVRLSDHFGKEAVALIFGNYT